MSRTGYSNFINKFDKKCQGCGKSLPKGNRVFGKKDPNRKWTIICHTCHNQIKKQQASDGIAEAEVVDIPANLVDAMPSAAPDPQPTDDKGNRVMTAYDLITMNAEWGM